jgi:hypothetical protein
MWWAPAAFVIVFGSGIFVGANWVRPSTAPTAVAPEPAEVAEPLAAGSHEEDEEPTDELSDPEVQPRRAMQSRAPTPIVVPVEVEEEVPVAPAPVPPAPSKLEYVELANLGVYQ